MYSATNGETSEIGITRTYCVHNGRPTTYQVQHSSEKNRSVHRRKRRNKHSSDSTPSRPSDEFLNKTGSPTKTMIIARSWEPATIQDQPSGPSIPTKYEFKVNAIYSPSKSPESQMNDGNVKKMTEKGSEQNKHS